MILALNTTDNDSSGMTRMTCNFMDIIKQTIKSLTRFPFSERYRCRSLSSGHNAVWLCTDTRVTTQRLPPYICTVHEECELLYLTLDYSEDEGSKQALPNTDINTQNNTQSYPDDWKLFGNR